MTHKLTKLKASEVIRILQRYGFNFISQRGSHQKWHQPDSGYQVIVPYHKGEQLPMGTIRSIIEGSGIPVEEFRS